MHVILGANGHVGSVVAQTLLDKGEPVRVVTRSSESAARWRERGAEVAVVDVNDTEALGQAFSEAQHLFLLNPPAPPASDTVTTENSSLASILEAFAKSKIGHVVAESTYGAQPGDDIGDLGILYTMEQSLRDIGRPTDVIRAAYYMSNWEPLVDAAAKDGKIHSLYPADFRLPMVSPGDVGLYAARFMERASPRGFNFHFVEGPERYCPDDVARAASQSLGLSFHISEVSPLDRERWLREGGFSKPAALSMDRMTKITLDRAYELPDQPLRGKTTLQEHFARLTREHKAAKAS